ncbi:MAG: TetR/AcrR family transcriptional regulator [Spirochaetales bacterium]|nr:TetR/AcrR family transcriptional regulator [Spirochaetales bacterium]
MRNKEKDELVMAERRNTILKEGFRLFEAKGIETTGMQEIADSCHLGIATLYRYYKNKTDLVIDIGTRKWQEYYVEIMRIRAQHNVDQMTAAQNLEFYLSFYIDLYNNHKDLLRFNSNFNSYVTHEGVTVEQLKPYLKAIGSISVLFHELYEKGKKDGTIRTDMSEEKMFASTAHIMLAVAVRYAQGLLYSAENETDRTEEFNLLKNIILKEFVI